MNEYLYEMTKDLTDEEYYFIRQRKIKRNNSEEEEVDEVLCL